MEINEKEGLLVQANYKFSLFGDQSVENISRFKSEASLGGEIRMAVSVGRFSWFADCV